MIKSINPRVVGSLLMGLGLVAAAFIMSRLGSTPTVATEAMYVASAPAPARAAITVGDQNNDGVEDWREPFLTAAPVLLNTDVSDYERDNTLTEQVSISLMENIMTSRSMGGPGIPTGELVSQSANQAINSIQDRVYSERDISIISDTDPTLIREYANTVANILANNDVKGLRNELFILEDAMRTKDQQYFDQIMKKSEMYAKNRDMLLALPVPANLTKEHLGLISIFNTLSIDLAAMLEIEKDPLKSLLRLRRYEESSAALAFALQAMYLALEKYPTLFTAEDPALAFSLFAEVQRR